MSAFFDEYCELAKTELDDMIDDDQNASKYGLNLAEVVTDYAPLVVNMNFVFQGAEQDSFYDDSFIHNIIHILQEIIEEKLNTTDEKSELLCCFLENIPYSSETKTYANLRFQFPYCIFDKNFQINTIIPTFILKLRTNNIFKLMEVHPNGDWPEIVSSIGQIFPFYGSKMDSKSSIKSSPLTLKTIYQVITQDDLENNNADIMQLKDFFDPATHSYVERNIIPPQIFQEENDKPLDYYLPFLLSLYFCGTILSPKEEKKQSRRRGSPAGVNEFEDDELDDEDPRYLAQIFLPMLSSKRFKRTDFWLIITNALWTIFDGDEEGLNLLVQYSE